MPGLRGYTLYLLKFQIYFSTPPVNKPAYRTGRQIPAFFTPKNKEHFAAPIE